ncbi:hypothetical protein Tco_0977587 [Tanacetum coccineum]|uniref:Uncharacterized protein n=1 Tax=Tanacetum coccineum TaxID=301880 RepID=A0ABQ5EKH7_9ASTR
MQMIDVTVAKGEIRFLECHLLKSGYKMITYFFQMNVWILGGVSSCKVAEVYLLAVSMVSIALYIAHRRFRTVGEEGEYGVFDFFKVYEISSLKETEWCDDILGEVDNK